MASNTSLTVAISPDFRPLVGEISVKMHRFDDSEAVRALKSAFYPSTKLPQRVEYVSTPQNTEKTHIFVLRVKNKVKFGTKEG